MVSRGIPLGIPRHTAGNIKQHHVRAKIVEWLNLGRRRRALPDPQAIQFDGVHHVLPHGVHHLPESRGVFVGLFRVQAVLHQRAHGFFHDNMRSPTFFAFAPGDVRLTSAFCPCLC